MVLPQSRHSLNGIIVPPSRQQDRDWLASSDFHDEEVEGELDAHHACEGSALPLIMRRLVAWSAEDTPTIDNRPDML